MTKRETGLSRLLPYVALALVAATVLALGLRANVCYAVEQSSGESYFRLLMRISAQSDESLAKLLGAITDAEREALFANPRDYLDGRGIALPVNAFQVTALDFGGPDKTWYAVAQQQEGLTFVAAGVGLFYKNVGIFIQAAVSPEDRMTLSSDAGSFLQLIDRVSTGALERLRAVMEDLNAKPVDDPQRADFLANPRGYLLAKDIRLPADYYRITAIDLERAATLDTVHTARPRGGLAVVPEGIGLFLEGQGLFIQEAI